MRKRIFIIHGWDGGPQNDWMPWAKKVFEAKGFEVHIPTMPDPAYPKIDTWVPFLAQEIGELNENTILIGHSIGCQTILRYLETLPENTKANKVIFVAGWVSLTPIAAREPEDQKIVKPWFETPINFDKIRSKADSFTAIFSDNDPFVPFEENSKTYEEKLGAIIILEKGKGHFSQDAGITELPLLLELI